MKPLNSATEATSFSLYSTVDQTEQQVSDQQASTSAGAGSGDTSTRPAARQPPLPEKHVPSAGSPTTHPRQRSVLERTYQSPTERRQQEPLVQLWAPDAFEVGRVGRHGIGNAFFHALARNLNTVVAPPATGGQAVTANILRTKLAIFLKDNREQLLGNQNFKAELLKEGCNIEQTFGKLLAFADGASEQWNTRLKNKKFMPMLMSAALGYDISIYRRMGSEIALYNKDIIRQSDLIGVSDNSVGKGTVTLLLDKKGKHFDSLRLLNPGESPSRLSTDAGPVDIIAVSPPEHGFMVANDTSNGLTMEEKKNKGLLSPSGRYELLDLNYDNPTSQKLLQLNDDFERQLSLRLEHRTAKKAQKMSKAISGFHTLNDAKSFVNDNLASKSEHVDSDVHHRRRENRLTKFGIYRELGNLSNADYSEKNLYSSMKKAFPKAGFDKPPADYQYGWCDDARALARKKAWLGQFKTEITLLKPTEENREIRKHFRKIVNTVKINDMLLNQRGYFGGSLEFKAGFKDDLEYWVYLMSAKTRAPKNQELAYSPKQMITYATSPESLMPYGNNFSMSFAHADIGKYKHIPRKELDRIENILQSMQKNDGILNDPLIGRLYQLAMLDGYERSNPRPLSLKEVLDGIEGLADAEDRLKELFTDILKLSWSDRDFDSLEENPFSRISHEHMKRLAVSDIRDPVLQLSTDPIENLRSGKRRGHVVGKKANMLFTARSASWAFRGKLDKIETKQAMDEVYGKYVGLVAPKDTSIHGKLTNVFLTSETDRDIKRKKEAIIEHDVAALDTWFLTAKSAHKPIYAGPSGHTLAYLNLYAHAVDELVVQRSNWIRQDKKISLLEQIMSEGALTPEDQVLLQKAKLLFNTRQAQYDLNKRVSRLEEKADDKNITEAERFELNQKTEILKINTREAARLKSEGVAIEDMPADKLFIEEIDRQLQKNLNNLIGRLNVDAEKLAEIDQKALVEASEKVRRKGYPSLEEARVVMMASLMGDKEHHSWDEIMIASHGIRTKVFEPDSPQNNLRYNFRGNYADMFTSGIDYVRDAAQAARKAVEYRYADDPVVNQWNATVSSEEYPGDQAVVTHESTSKRDLAAFRAAQNRGVTKSDMAWAATVYAGTLVPMLYDTLTTVTSQVPVAEMGKKLAICAADFTSSAAFNATMPDVAMKQVTERFGTPFVAGAIILAGAAVSDAIEFKKTGTLSTISAAKNMTKFTPQISIKALSTSLGSALTIGLGKWLPGQLVKCSPKAAAASIAVREGVQFVLNNPMNAAAFRLSEKVPRLMSHVPGVKIEPEMLLYAKDHTRKAILAHFLRSSGVLAVVTALQATGNISTDQFSIDNLLLNFMMHASTEFMVDSLLEKRGWATKETGADADAIMRNTASAALGHPSGKVADMLVPKPKGYTHEGRLPKLQHADEKALFALTGGNSSATLGAKIAVSIATYVAWSALNRANSGAGAIGMNVLSQTVISLILAAKRLQDSGSDSPSDLPAVVRWYQDAKEFVRDQLGLDVSSDVAAIQQMMEQGEVVVQDPETVAGEEAAASPRVAGDIEQALGEMFAASPSSSAAKGKRPEIISSRGYS